MARLRDCGVDRVHQLLRRERLAQAGDATHGQGLLTRDFVVQRRHEDDGKAGTFGVEMTAQLDPGHAAEMNIQQKTINLRAGGPVEEFFRGCEFSARQTVGVQQVPGRFQHAGIVVDDAHDLSLCGLGVVASQDFLLKLRKATPL